jgi:hypothetical protein
VIAVPIWPYAVLGLLGAVGFLAWMAIPAARARYVRSIARQQGLQLDAAFAPHLTQYYVRRMRFTAYGIMVVFFTVLGIAAAGFALPFEGTSVWIAGAWAVIPLATVGGGLGTVGSALRWPRTSSGDTATGRLTPPTRADVVAPWEERWQLIVVAIGATLPVIVVATGLGQGRPELIAALVLGGLGVLATIGWRVAADRVLRNRPITGDARSLVWSDALRSDAVRLGGPVAAALATSAFALALGTLGVELESSGSGFGGVLVSFGITVILIGFAAVTISQQVTAASRRWQRQLHPALSEGGTA